MIKLLSRITFWAPFGERDSGLARSRRAVRSLDTSSMVKSPLMEVAAQQAAGRSRDQALLGGMLSSSGHRRRHEMLAHYLEFANHDRRRVAGR